jgi:hypothetical protein
VHSTEASAELSRAAQECEGQFEVELSAETATVELASYCECLMVVVVLDLE